MTSVIIPAYNEEAVIGRCLEMLLRGARPGELEVIVACNGCRDRTAEIARAFGDPVKVVETTVASKVAALNLGESVATAFPRLYLDADVRLGIESVRAMAEVLADPSGGAPAASPEMEMDFSLASWAVRAFYGVWRALPYTREGMVGVGVFGLSEAGRSRFDRFPDVINDDGYARLLFRAHERPVVRGARSVVTAPATVKGLCAIMTRSRLGIYELHRRFPELKDREQANKSYGGAARAVLSRPALWPAAVVYLWVNLLTRLRARRQARRVGTYVWERDESSRVERSPASTPISG
jgi:glycosyltransferase involved in cell wall biosynthesis